MDRVRGALDIGHIGRVPLHLGRAPNKVCEHVSYFWYVGLTPGVWVRVCGSRSGCVSLGPGVRHPRLRL
jgi:hypothetical protein